MNIKNFLYKSINFIFTLAILITLFGVIRHPYFNIANLKGASLVLGLALVCFIVCIIISSNVRNYFLFFLKQIKDYIRKNIKVITILIVAITILLQFILVSTISAPIGWDVKVIFLGVTKNQPMDAYLSRYPNNAFFFFVMLGITKIANIFVDGIGNTWLFWQLCSTVFIDLGFFFLYTATKRLFSHMIAYLVFYLSILSLALSPLIIVPYTDIGAFTIVSFSMFLYSFINTKKQNSLLFSMMLGICCAILYLIKPSAIIFIIAWSIVKFIDCLQKKIQPINLAKVLNILIAFIFMFGTISSFSIYRSTQTTIEFNKNEQYPMTHWMMMGLKGNGGYNLSDSNATSSQKKYQDKKDYNIKVIKKRLKDYGPIGYTKFLLNKQYYNTAAGDFDWKDYGPRPMELDRDSNRSRFKIFLQDNYFQVGKWTSFMKLYMQIMWLITIIGMFITGCSFNMKKIDEKELIIKLTIIGAMMFLLLFEGGRSRYLIQFLPFFYLLSAIGW
ncbi:glycosyltransferase family protein, partial [Enterococcus faecalis]